MGKYILVRVALVVALADDFIIAHDHAADRYFVEIVCLFCLLECHLHVLLVMFFLSVLFDFLFQCHMVKPPPNCYNVF